MENTFTQLHQHNLTVNKEKCKCMKEQLTYMGRTISAAPRVFLAYWYMYRDWDFNKSIGESAPSDRQTGKSYGSI